MYEAFTLGMSILAFMFGYACGRRVGIIIGAEEALKLASQETVKMIDTVAHQTAYVITKEVTDAVRSLYGEQAVEDVAERIAQNILRDAHSNGH